MNLIGPTSKFGGVHMKTGSCFVIVSAWVTESSVALQLIV